MKNVDTKEKVHKWQNIFRRFETKIFFINVLNYEKYLKL